MPAGTIALTNNSTAVSGTGTSFTTELKVGDFIGVIAGGTPYTLIVAAIASNNQLTLGGAYAGPTASGLAWNAVPASLLYAVTQQIMNDMGTALRGMNSQLVNWQKIYSDASSVTVERPDRTTFTGPSWGYMATQFGNKLDKNQNLSDVANKTTAWNNLAVYGSVANTAAQGNDARLGTINNKSGGSVTGDVIATRPTGSYGVGPTVSSIVYPPSAQVPSVQWQFFSEVNATSRYGHLRLWQDASYKDWYFDYSSGSAYAPSSWQNNSDERIKDKITRIQDPLEKMKLIKGCTWVRKDDQSKGIHGIGFIAQDVQAVFPEIVSHARQGSVSVDGVDIDDPLAINPGDIGAALHHEAILALMDMLDNAFVGIAELQSRMKAIDGLDA